MTSTLLCSRVLLRLSPLDEVENVTIFLQGLVTQDVAGPLPVWSGLLTPQGKVLFDFMVWRDGSDLLIDCEADAAEALTKRLTLYRLRRKIAILPEPGFAVHWSVKPQQSAVPDPRLAGLGWRWLAPLKNGQPCADLAWRAHRLAFGVCEGRGELGDGETLWLECNAGELNGVSFTKGCYVGQENTARMNWRQKVNRRLVVVPLDRSDAARRRVAVPELGLAIDYLRVEAIDEGLLPSFLKDG